ncbi:MAG: UvrB/UvrC motif-containing protein, partial [Minisyncoccia bacterium]
LHYHLGLDPGLEEGKTSLKDYRANLRRLIAVIEGKRGKIGLEIKKEMDAASRIKDFELAAKLRNQFFALQNLGNKVIFSDKEFLDISKDHALDELVKLLGLKKFPSRIEGYDISHMSGTNVVASMVVFTNGVSNKSQYRKFKTYINRNNDFANMNETINRRLSERNVKKWGLPDMVLIDGGKGQLEAAIAARNELEQGTIPFIGLAKREEQVVIKNDDSSVQIDQKVLQKLGGFAETSDKFTLLNLPHSTNLVKLLQRIRDESHRFAVSYHSVLKRSQQTASLLEEIPGIGPSTRKKLIRVFGSAKAASQAKQSELEAVIGPAKTKALKNHFKTAVY